MPSGIIQLGLKGVEVDGQAGPCMGRCMGWCMGMVVVYVAEVCK